MYKAVYLKNGALNVDRQAYLSKHKIIFQTPQYQGYNGLPIGNGRFGGMMYSSHTKTHFVLNHTDAIDFRADGNFDAWSLESEEDNTAHLSCGHLTIGDGMPSFDTLYLEAFDASLDIANGVASLYAKTPFSSNRVVSFVNDGLDLQVIRLENTSEEPVERTVTLSRWGSRNFFHDYEQVAADKTKNLSGTSCGEIDGVLYVTQNVRGCSTAVLLTLSGGTPRRSHKLNGHSIEFILESSSAVNDTLYLRTLAESKPIDLEAAVRKFKDDLNGLTAQKALDCQSREWNRFWEKSFVYLPEDDYLENLYVMYAYMLNSCSRGKYPVTFGSIWCHNHDSRNWGHFYHWNHQQTYWGLQAAGHDELAANYYDYRFRMLQNAIADGERLFGVKGAYISDITNYNGYQAIEPDTVRNLTCAAQIALDFFRQYQYRQDRKFLEEKAYPFLYWALMLYEGILFDNEGVYEVKGGSTCYESYWNLKRTITDRNMLIALVDAAAETSILLGRDEDKRELWRDLRDRIYEMPVVTDEDGEEKLPIISAGVKWDNTAVKHSESNYPLNTFGLCQLCGVFPAGLIGIGKRDEVFSLAQNTFRALTRGGAYNGHSTAPILAARLGLREETLQILKQYIQRYQCFHNGLMHFANVKQREFYADVYHSRVIRPGDVTDWERIHEKALDERIDLDAGPFLHCYFEAHAELFTAVNEMLLQSYDGVIRVFPATPEHYQAAFTLRAAGGFEVTSELHDGAPRYIYVKSLCGNPCAVELPWAGEPIRVMNGSDECVYSLDSGILRFETKKDNGYLIERSAFPLYNYYVNEIPYRENDTPKHCMDCQIGCERQF